MCHSRGDPSINNNSKLFTFSEVKLFCPAIWNICQVKMVAVEGISAKIVNGILSYDTVKIVTIKNKKVGILHRILQIIILGYVVGYVIGMKKFVSRMHVLFDLSEILSRHFDWHQSFSHF